MLSAEQWRPWLESASRHAYQKAGHLLHPEEQAKAFHEPGEYITEHSGMDPATLDHLSYEEAGKELAKGIRRSTSEQAALFDQPEMKLHMDVWKH